MKSDQEILLERAVHVARPKAQESDNDGEALSLVEFILGNEHYAVEGRFIREVLALKDLASIPGTPPFVMGVINLRGKIVSIINLKVLFGLMERGLTEMNKVIILENGAMRFGLVTDGIIGNKQVPVSKICSPPVTLGPVGAEFVQGVSAEGLIVLNSESLLTSKRIVGGSKLKS